MIRYIDAMFDRIEKLFKRQRESDAILATDYFGKEIAYQKRRGEIISEVSKITEISEHEKTAIKERLEKSELDFKPSDGNGTWWSYVSQGWYNEPMKKYLIQLGYKCYPDGNVIDIIVKR